MKPHRIDVYRDEAGKWRWRRAAGNNRVVAASEQGYRTRWYCTRDAKRDAAGIRFVVNRVD